jgi:hypothetical protein
MNKTGIAFIIYFICIALAMWFVPSLSSNAWHINNFIYSTLSFFASIVAFSTIKVMGGGQRTKSLLAIALGVASWFIADFTWGMEYYITGKINFPSYGDWFYLIGYILFLIGLIIEMKVSQLSIRTMQKVILYPSIFISLLLIGVYSYFSLFLSFSSDASFWEKVVTIGYGIGDNVLIVVGMFLVLLIWNYRGGKISKIWIYLFLGFLMTLIADLLYSIYTVPYGADVNPITNIINYFYNIAYVFMAIYFIKIKMLISEVQQKAKSKNS